MFENYPDIVTINEASKMLRVSRASVTKLINSGELTYFKYGKNYKLDKAGIINYVKNSINSK